MGNVCFQNKHVGRKDPEVVPHEADLASGVAENHKPTMAENRTPKELTDADSSGGDEDQGSAPASSVPTTSCSEFHSPRIASMLSSRSEFETELEYRTAHSKVHWSELRHHEGASSSEESKSGSGGSGTGSGDQPGVDHRQYFEELQKDAIWGGFCSAVADLELGRKLGEGAQAVIYEALNVTFATELSKIDREAGMMFGYVVKVMKPGYALEDLHRQWPRGMAGLKVPPKMTTPSDLYKGVPVFLHGALVKDHATVRNQFGFVMRKHWGDLRRLIDLRMERNNAKGPPFSSTQVTRIIFMIAFAMNSLHERGIIHRDLKTANVLLSPSKGKENCDLVSSNDPRLIFPYVADWECSVGVVGTGFWRAPEILQQMKDGTPSSALVFTKEMDVYSFAMTCYEIVTGLLPFEGLPFSETRDAILDGARPELPHDMNPIIENIISGCWEPDPSDRCCCHLRSGNTTFRMLPFFPSMKNSVNSRVISTHVMAGNAALPKVENCSLLQYDIAENNIPLRTLRGPNRGGSALLSFRVRWICDFRITCLPEAWPRCARRAGVLNPKP